MLRVNNDTLWHQIRILFLASALLFLINIFFGFDNALTTGSIARWQILVHAHAGTLGWVTLSAIGLAFWALALEPDVSEAFARQVKLISGIAIGIFSGYILAFGLAFSSGRPFLYLLPIFGIAASLVIWTTAIFFISQLRTQPAVTTTHILIATGLVVASIGSTVGVLLGLEYIVGFFIPGSDRIGAHAAVMDAYLLLFAAAIVELLLGKDSERRWTWAGLVLALTWGLAAVFVLHGILFNSILGMLFVPLLLAGLIIFFLRTGRRALRAGPIEQGPKRWLFFGTLWAALWALFFIYVGATYAQDLSAIPGWVDVVFQHTAFIGAMTNLLLGAYAVHSWNGRHVLRGVETAALWLINLGLPLFLGLKLLADIRPGAIVMGTGVLLGVITMVVRLLLSDLGWAYDLLYRGRPPWEMDGPRAELVQAVENGHLQPCRAIDLGCGTGDNAIFLAKNGFDITGIDLSSRAITQAREKARAAGVSPTFAVGDVTDLQEIEGPFDLVVDYGCLGCVIGMTAREKYAQTLLRLTRPGSQFVLLSFAKDKAKPFNFIPNALQSGEVEQLFSQHFEVKDYDPVHENGPLGLPVEFRWMQRL